MSEPLLLAARQARITPGTGHRLGGYTARQGVATGTHDELEAALIWLSTADDPGVLWLSLDVIAVDAELTGLLAETVAAAAGIPQDRIVVCASHTHSGPEGWTEAIHPALPGHRDPEQVRHLLTALTEAGARLRDERIPVHAKWWVGETSEVGGNRHQRDGPHDPTVGVLALVRDEAPGSVAGLLFDYACHPTVLGPDNLAWSADWPGTARRALAESLSAPDGSAEPVIGFLQGAAGDISSRFVRNGRDHTEVKRLGELLAGSAATAVAGEPIELPDGPVRLSRTVLRLPYRDLPPAEDRELLHREAKQEWERVRGLHSENHAVVRIAQTRYEGITMLGGTKPLTGSAEVPITVVSLGEVAWLHLPFELFASLGLRIRRDSPFRHTRVIGYADGYLSYLPDADGHRDGVYEAQITLFRPDAGERVIAECLRLLDEHQRAGLSSGVGLGVPG